MIPQLAGIQLTDLVVHRVVSAGDLGQLEQPALVRFSIDWDISDEALGPQPGDPPQPGTAHSYRFQATTQVRVERAPSEDEVVPLATFEVTYEAAYRLAVDEPGREFEDISAFVEANMQFQIWPYVREAIASAASRMGLVGLFVPQLDRSLNPVPNEPDDAEAAIPPT